jgi:hypothetical protein
VNRGNGLRDRRAASLLALGASAFFGSLLLPYCCQMPLLLF